MLIIRDLAKPNYCLPSRDLEMQYKKMDVTIVIPGLSGDIILQMFNDLFLLFDNLFYYIANRYKTYELIIFNDRKMSNKFAGHQIHTIFNCIFWCYRDRILRHQFTDWRGLRRFTLQYQFSCVVPFRKNSFKLSLIDD